MFSNLSWDLKLNGKEISKLTIQSVSMDVSVLKSLYITMECLFWTVFLSTLIAVAAVCVHYYHAMSLLDCGPFNPNSSRPVFFLSCFTSHLKPFGMESVSCSFHFQVSQLFPSQPFFICIYKLHFISTLCDLAPWILKIFALSSVSSSVSLLAVSLSLFSSYMYLSRMLQALLCASKKESAG